MAQTFDSTAGPVDGQITLVGVHHRGGYSAVGFRLFCWPLRPRLGLSLASSAPTWRDASIAVVDPHRAVLDPSGTGEFCARRVCRRPIRHRWNTGCRPTRPISVTACMAC